MRKRHTVSQRAAQYARQISKSLGATHVEFIDGSERGWKAGYRTAMRDVAKLGAMNPKDFVRTIVEFTGRGGNTARLK